jgi:hypothetical protein
MDTKQGSGTTYGIFEPRQVRQSPRSIPPCTVCGHEADGQDHPGCAAERDLDLAMQFCRQVRP